ncbi:MAG: hypothetical protein EXS13_09335 [Planctomycetes bacterium]|nr:hypothetical protein [Planctomycetota bacterium]
MAALLLDVLVLCVALQAEAPADDVAPEVLARAQAIAAIGPTDHAPSPRTVDVLHYVIHLALDPVSGRIEGFTELELRPCAMARRELSIDADELEVASVTLDDAPILFRREGARLEIDLGREAAPEETLRLKITYSATPRRGLFFVRSVDDRCRMVWSQNQCQMASAWFPCRDYPDDRASSELFLNVPEAWRTIGNGVLIEATPADGGRRIDHWRMDFPHPTYLTSLVAGEFMEFDLGRVRDLPLFGYASVERAGEVAAALQPTGRMIELLEQFVAVPYPFPTYRQVAVESFPWGGMENIAASTLDQEDLRAAAGPREGTIDSDALVMHELAHQWFGDLVTPACWADLWLAEGFATFAELLWRTEEQGADAATVAALELQERLAKARDNDPRAIVSALCVELDDLFTEHVYEGGGAVLLLLRETLGAPAFATLVQTFVARSQNKSVGTADFEQITAEIAGRDLAGFFAEWLHAPGQPEIDCEWRYDEAGRRLELVAHQKQQGEGVPEVYHAPLTVAWATGAGRKTTTLQLDARRVQVAIDCEERPRYVHWNLGATLPGHVIARQQPAEWRAQLRQERDPVGRIAAARGLAQAWPSLPPDPATETVATLAALVQAMVEEAMPEVRVEVAAALGKLKHAVARSALASAAWDVDTRVRTAALEALGTLDGDEIAAGVIVRRLQTEEIESVRVAGMEALGALLGGRAAGPLHQVAGREDGSAELRGGALKAAANCAGLPAEAVTAIGKTAIAEAGRDRPLALRLGAIAALGTLCDRNPAALAALLACLDDPWPNVRAAALDALTDQEALPRAALPALVKFHDCAALADQKSLARERIAALLAPAAK